MIYFIIFLAGIIFAWVLRRLIVAAAYWCGMALSVVFSWRVIERFDHGFTTAYAMPIFVGAISALVVCILCSGYIRHTLIIFYLRRTIQKDKDAAQAGRLW